MGKEKGDGIFCLRASPMAQASSLWLKQWQASILYYLCGRLISHACFFNLGGFGWEVGGTGLASDWDGLWLMWQRV